MVHNQIANDQLVYIYQLYIYNIKLYSQLFVAMLVCRLQNNNSFLGCCTRRLKNMRLNLKMSIFHLLYTYSRYNLKNIYFESGELFGLNLISLYLKTHASPLPRKKICCKKKNLRLQHFFIWFLRLVICLSVFMNIFVCDVVLIIK